jgi:hypothetical protein
MAPTTRERIERLEVETRFRIWVRRKRFLDSFSIEELEVMKITGQFPERPEPAPGMSPLDNMAREELQRLWKEDQQTWAGRNREELRFFVLHGHWPEQECDEQNCSKTRSDEIVSRHEAREARCQRAFPNGAL